MISLLRTGIVSILLLPVCRVATGTSVLLHPAPGGAPGLLSVQTYTGKADPIVTPVKPSASVTVVLLMDTLSPAELDSVKKDLLALHTSLHGRPLRLALVRNGSLGVAGPFSSRALLKSALTQVQPAADPSESVSPSAALDTLSAGAPQLGADWSRVLLIGEFPALDPSAIEYASAVLLRAFGSQHLQVSWFAPAGGSDAWLSLFRSTGGTIVHGALSDFSLEFNESSWPFVQIDWRPAAPSSGFIVFRSILSDPIGGVLLEAPDIAASAGASLPSIERYSAMQAKIADATAAVNREPITPADAQRIRDDLQAALEANPRDAGALVTAAVFYEKFKDYATAASVRASLVEIRPLDGTAYAALGHALTLGSDFGRAEAALERAADLNTRTPQVADDFARIRIARKDDKGALPYLDEALRADATRQDLWFLKAGAAERLQNSSLAMDSFEHGLALGGAHIPEAASLVRLYLAAKQDAKAMELAGSVIANLPPDPSLRAEFADHLDDLHRTNEALAAWRRVLEVQPNSERARDRIARLLLESGDARAAEQAAETGLAVAPKFADLYIAKADALEKQGRLYSARDALEKGAAVVPDIALLSRLAAMKDTYVGSAAEGYARLAESLGASSPERLRALERGFAVSVRDGDFKQAQSFAALLESAGRPEFRGLLGLEERPDKGTMVPGGLDALAYAAHAKERVPPERFFAEYCRTLIDQIDFGAPGSKQYIEGIREHFQRIAALEALGKRDGKGSVITLALDGKDARRDTEKVLGLLGIKLRTSKGQVELDRGEQTAQAKKQDTVSALALDEVGMQEALRAGQPYAFEIPDEWALVYPSETLWRESFYAKDDEPGGFATAVLRMPKMARLYVGISSLDRKTVSDLLSAVNLKTLYDRYADLLYLFGPAFALQGTHAAVPGGPSAEPIWESLAGVSPAQPGGFFRALLEREGGQLLAFFFTMSQLDRSHQAFFTANLSRTAQFYKAFAASRAMRRRSVMIPDSAFTDVLRSVPLDGQGHVDFPGSAEVWRIAKAHSFSETQTAKLLKKLSKAAAPAVEDEILLRLAQTRDNDNGAHHTELDNFLAVSRVHVHRTEPLDEESALLLAQRYDDSSESYAYFTDLTALGASDFRQFFAAVDRIKSHSPLDANLELGQLHALIEWICLLKRRQAVQDGEATKLFRYVCDHFASADGGAAYTAASLGSVRAILGYCRPAEKTASPDEEIRSCLLGSYAQPASRRTIEFQGVLDAQKVPSLDALFSIYDGAAKLAATGSGASELAAIEKGAAGLPFVELPKGTGVTGQVKQNILRYDPAAVHNLVGQLSQKAAKDKANPKEIERLSQKLLAELEPGVTAGLAGPIYAYFLRPSDLVVSEDPLLLRKHRYFDFVSGNSHTQTILESQFFPDSQGAGSYFAGGFAQFGLAGGAAAGVGWKGSSPHATGAIAAQIAAIRGATWDQLEESDQRLVSLRIAVAREWIFESARRPEELHALSEETVGLVSLARRADLLDGIASRNWGKVWDAITLPDLFALGGTYLDRYKTDPWSSPVTAALRSVIADNEGSRLPMLGAISYHAFGCGHPHLHLDAPYEEYEHMFPAEIAERSAEFKLFLVFQADRLGVEPPVLANVAEVLAAKAFRAAQMADFRDWRSLLAAYASITPDDLKRALEQ